MSWLHSFFFRFRSLFTKKRIETDLAEEIQLHLQLQIEANLAAGMSAKEARLAARREFGGVTQITERYREARGVHWLTEGLRDLRYSFQSLRRQKGFTVTVLLIFTICMAANIVIFSLVERVLLRPLPFTDPERLVTVFDCYPNAGLPHAGISPLHYLERKAKIGAFEMAAAWVEGIETLGRTGAPESVNVATVTPSFFPTLGAGAALGRTFTHEEGSEGKDFVALLSDQLWRARFGADPTIVGQTVHLNAASYIVVGVMPPGFQFLSEPAQIWVPLGFTQNDRQPDQRYRSDLKMVARLRAGVTAAQAQAQLDALNARPIENDILAKLAHEMGFQSRVRDLHADHIADLQPKLLLLQMGVLSLLLIGIVNLANLVLVRASGRTQEFAIRQALGASSFQLARALIVETVLLSMVGGLLGIGLAGLALRVIGTLESNLLPREVKLTLDLTTTLTALGVSFIIGLALVGPALWQTLQPRRSLALDQGSRGNTSSRAIQRFRHALVIAQISTAFTLLAGTGLLGLSFIRVLAVNPGFHRENVITGTISLPWSNYQESAQRSTFSEKLLIELRSRPGVKAAGFSTRIPFAGADKDDFSPIQIENRLLTQSESTAEQYYRGVGGDYFAALGVPLVQGRFFTEDDDQADHKCCIIDEVLAHRYWPSGDALGHRLTFGVSHPKAEDYFTVVGVVGSVKQNSLADRDGYGVVYYPNRLFPALGFTLVMRTDHPFETAGSVLRAAILHVDPEIPMTDLKTMDTRLSESLTDRRIPFFIVSIFAGVSLVLAAIGLYGVLAYQVSQRRREIGVRMALGAQPKQILGQFLGLGFRFLMIALPLGLVGAALSGRLIIGLLFDVRSLDPWILGACTLTLGSITLLACIFPCLRAAHISPVETLRDN